MDTRLNKLTDAALFDRILNEADAARRYFNALPRDLETTDPDAYEVEGNRVIEASRRADRARPVTWRQFARLLNHLSEQGEDSIDDDNVRRLIVHANRLLEPTQAEGI